MLTLNQSPRKTLYFCRQEAIIYLTAPSPASGFFGVPSGNFSVSSLNLAETITITPSSTLAGTFSPSSFTLAPGETKTFTFTPSVVGVASISISNDGGYNNPDPVSYTSLFIERALVFDGVNDYVLINNFSMWGRSQPWTAFLAFDFEYTGGIQVFFTNKFFVPNDLSSRMVYGSLANVQFQYRSDLGARQNRIFVDSFGSSKRLYTQVTSNGTGNNPLAKSYADGVDVTSIAVANLVAGDVMASISSLAIGRNLEFGGAGFMKGKLKEISFVDYAKTPAEIAADYAAGTQSAGTGSFLFRINFSDNDPNSLTFNSSDSNNYSCEILGQTTPNYAIW